MKNIKSVYLNFIKLLDEKIAITQGEIEHIKRAVAFIIKTEENKQNTSSNGELPQFVKDCYLIRASLVSLIEKIEKYEEDLGEIKEALNLKENLLIANNVHLQHLLRLDCMQSRSYYISEKLEYLYRAYENLIGPYNSQYLPMPSISRRIKTSTLMLFFSKELNSDFHFMKKHFFGIEKKNTFDKQYPEGIFSTWNFSSHEHVKDIDGSNRTFISLSFWFYEKQIFYPIAYHEIAHSVYMNKSYRDELKDIKIKDKDKARIAEELLQSSDSIFTRSMIYTIYQDIVADFSAYSLTGTSYIFAFFYTGFMQKIYKNFYKDFYTESEMKQEGVANEERRCSYQHQNMTLLDWAHNMQARDDNFISFYVRIKLLIKLHNKLKQNDLFKDELEGISDVLNLIYPDSNFKKKYNTFENILNSFEPQSNQYDYTKNFILLLTNLLEKEVFDKKKLHLRVERTLKKTKEKFRGNKVFQQNIENKYKELFKHYDGFKSQYDLYWKQRFHQVAIDEKTSLGRLLRLYNLTKNGIIKNNEIKLEEIIYELTFIKFHNDKNPYYKYINNNGKECCAKGDELKEPRVSYAFGPYDISIFSKNTTNEVDKFLSKKSEECTFFTERHALFLLEEIQGSIKDANALAFDLCIAIDLEKEFYTKLVDLISKKINNCFCNMKVFASLGNEDYIVYISGINLDDIDTLTTTKFYNINQLKNIATTVLLNKNAREKKSNEIVHNRNIVLLCKIKKNGGSHNDALKTIKDKINCYNNKQNTTKKLSVKLFKKYGIFDLIILLEKKQTLEEIETLIGLINNHISDVQFELQNEFPQENQELQFDTKVDSDTTIIYLFGRCLILLKEKIFCRLTLLLHN